MEESAISLPGRIPGFKSDYVKVLPLSETKIGVWRVYETACKAADKHPVSYSKFLQIWGQFYPYVVMSKPMTDLCLTYQQNTNKLQRAANLLECEKVKCIRAHQDHINITQSERAGKGANATISYVHYYFAHHGLGETDNCWGQNKNNCVVLGVENFDAPS